MCCVLCAVCCVLCAVLCVCVCCVLCASRVVCSYVAAKNYYFSVGGGCRQFEEMVKKDGLFDTTVEKVIKGLEPITSYARAATYPSLSLSLLAFIIGPIRWQLEREGDHQGELQVRELSETTITWYKQLYKKMKVKERGDDGVHGAG